MSAVLHHLFVTFAAERAAGLSAPSCPPLRVSRATSSASDREPFGADSCEGADTNVFHLDPWSRRVPEEAA